MSESEFEDHEGYPVTVHHVQAFGMIIQWFARHEYLMHIIATALLNANIGAITMLMTGLGYAGKRDAVKSLLNYVDINEDYATKINEYLDKLHTHSSLRNWIAHNTWVRNC